MVRHGSGLTGPACAKVTTPARGDAAPRIRTVSGMEAAVQTEGLTKHYGRTVAVDDLSIAVRPGLVTGFVGPNGAGKTTTMHLLLGLSSPSSGEALVKGRRYATISRPLTVVGALLDARAFHPSRSARSHLRWLAQSNGLPTGRADEVLRLVGLTKAASRRAGALSLGMRQRLGIAGALLGDPPILILDEPTIGLDPEGIQWLRETLRRLAAEGRTVLVSSHHMSELEDTADHLIVIGRGRLLADVSVGELIANASGERVEIRTPDAQAAMTLLAGTGRTVMSSGRDRLVVHGMAPNRVAELLVTRQIRLDELRPTRATLEEAYFRLTRGAEAHTALPIGEERSVA
jgi:ABC-2 type transport system ATP-binding protein